MRPSVLGRLQDASGEPFRIASVASEHDGDIVEGMLGSRAGRVPIRRSIPRFVDEPPYLSSFGEQWNRYRRTQIDKVNGTTLSRDRLLSGTGWKLDELRGASVLEVGCGAGRFTQVLLDAGAEVVALDASAAVDACWANNGPHERLTVVQADLFAMPFAPGSFDRVFCYGVLQHTPDPRRAFEMLLHPLRSGGEIAVDLYRSTPWVYRWTAKHWYRWLTKRMKPEPLARLVEWYVPRWLPIDTWCGRQPVLRRLVPALVPCWNYTGILNLSPDLMTQWAVLDTFDALSAYYDQPQTLRRVRQIFRDARLTDIHVRVGGNGILGNARKP